MRYIFYALILALCIFGLGHMAEEKETCEKTGGVYAKTFGGWQYKCVEPQK